MTSGTATRDFRQELAAVDREIEEKNRFRDRYAASGNDRDLQRITTELAGLEQRKRNIESARRGLHEIALEEARAKDRKARQAAIPEANQLLDELLQQARELEGIEGHMLRKLSEIHHTEDRIATTLAPFAKDDRAVSFLRRASLLVGRLEIETFLERSNLVGLGDRTAKAVVQARELVDRIVALPQMEETT